MAFSEIERAHLVDALEAAGPGAPTLCEGWQARHLAAHVVLRERAPLVGAGAAVPALADRADRAVDELAATAEHSSGWADLVAQVASGPPRISPLSWAGDAANLVEFAVHTEDVRRGAGPAAPLGRSAEHLDALFSRVARAARLHYRRAGVGVVLVVPGGPRAKVRRARGDAGTVVVRGAAIELALHASGRGAVADVSLAGDDFDLADLATTHPSPHS